MKRFRSLHRRHGWHQQPRFDRGNRTQTRAYTLPRFPMFLVVCRFVQKGLAADLNHRNQDATKQYDAY
jgi:hypothetical protein